MTTTVYLRKGRARPFHIVGADGETAVCGAIRRGEGDVYSLAVAPSPLNAAQVCAACLAAVASHSTNLRSSSGELSLQVENSGCSDFGKGVGE